MPKNSTNATTACPGMPLAPILGIDGSQVGQAELPAFGIAWHLVHRALTAARAAARQPYGASPRSGRESVAKLSRRRRKYKSAYGRGISRAPRKTLARRGSFFVWRGAKAPYTVGGAPGHPPKAEKVWAKKINRKEAQAALRSAVAAGLSSLAGARHVLPKGWPFVLANEFEALQKTGQLVAALRAIGLGPELDRCARKAIRPGRGKARGRRYKSAIGPLLIFSKACPAMRAAANIPGLATATPAQLEITTLAPGGLPRLCLFTAAALHAYV